MGPHLSAYIGSEKQPPFGLARFCAAPPGFYFLPIHIHVLNERVVNKTVRRKQSFNTKSHWQLGKPGGLWAPEIPSVTVGSRGKRVGRAGGSVAKCSPSMHETLGSKLNICMGERDGGGGGGGGLGNYILHLLISPVTCPLKENFFCVVSTCL